MQTVLLLESALVQRIAKKNSVKEIGGWLRQLKEEL